MTASPAANHDDAGTGAWRPSRRLAWRRGHDALRVLALLPVRAANSASRACCAAQRCCSTLGAAWGGGRCAAGRRTAAINGERCVCCCAGPALVGSELGGAVLVLWR